MNDRSAYYIFDNEILKGLIKLRNQIKNKRELFDNLNLLQLLSAMTSWKAKVTSVVIIILILLKEETALARIFSNQKVVHGVVFSSDAF